jgi:hypothetical protein
MAHVHRGFQRSGEEEVVPSGVVPDVGRDLWPCPSADGKRNLTAGAECLSAQGWNVALKSAGHGPALSPVQGRQPPQRSKASNA